MCTFDVDSFRKIEKIGEGNVKNSIIHTYNIQTTG